jgi:hypothetical protein
MPDMTVLPYYPYIHFTCELLDLRQWEKCVMSDMSDMVQSWYDAENLIP